MLEKAKDELDTKGEDEIQNLLEKVCNHYKSFEPCFYIVNSKGFCNQNTTKMDKLFY